MDGKLPYEDMLEKMAREYAKVTAGYTAPTYTGKTENNQKELIKPLFNLYQAYGELHDLCGLLFLNCGKNEPKELLLAITKEVDFALKRIGEAYMSAAEKAAFYKPLRPDKSVSYGDGVRRMLIIRSQVLEMLKLYSRIEGFGLSEELADSVLDFRLTALIAF